MLEFPPCPSSKHFQTRNLNVTQKIQFALHIKVKNMLGNGENAGDQHFSPFATMFSKRYQKMLLCRKGLNCAEQYCLLRILVMYRQSLPPLHTVEGNVYWCQLLRLSDSPFVRPAHHMSICTSISC